MTNTPSGRGLVSREDLLPHIKSLTASGMSYTLIARRARVAHSTICYLVRGITASCSADNARRILSVQPGQFDHISQRPVLGTARRVQALHAAGHSRAAIRAAAPAGSRLTDTGISKLANSAYNTIDGSTAHAIDIAYRRLENQQGTSGKARARAASERWAPATCWDDDTIDDPNAHPEWTGACGTDHGWWLHNTHNIPACQPCQQAHDEWMHIHRQLPKKQMFSALARAKAAASNRGAELAADARELLSYGCTPEVAAARLGVTREHLMQELRRHPDAANTYDTAA